MVKGIGTFSLQGKNRLTGTLHPGKERSGGEEEAIEVSEMIYGTEMVNKEKSLFPFKN